jgi:hypothetical protein
MTKPGDAFELEVYGRLELELQTGGLGILPAAARVFHRKGYHSPARRGDIIFDVAVEVSRPGADSPYLIWVWECKDYGHRVPVDDVEEFQKKLEQIGPSRAKGTIISRNGFQQGAFNVARTWGIGLVKLPQSGTLERLLESVHVDPSAKAVERNLTMISTMDRHPLYVSCYAMTASGIPTDSFERYIRGELADAIRTAQEAE